MQIATSSLHDVISLPTPSIAATSSARAQLTLDASTKDLELLAPEWRQLAALGPYAEPFFQPYWFQAFAASFRGDSPMSIVTVHERSRLIGILPLMRRDRFFEKIPARTLTSLAGIHSCRFDFIVEPGRRTLAARLAWRKLREDSSWDVLEALNVPSDGAFESIMHEAEADGFHVARWPTLHSPYLSLPAPGSDPFSNCPPRYKHNRGRFRNSRTKLGKVGALTFEVSTHFSPSLFQTFLSLEASGWKGKNGGAIACSPSALAFYSRMLPHAAAAGHLRLGTLRLDGEPIAMDMGLLTSGRLYFSPKVAYDESFSKYSPGHVLNLFLIDDLVAHGVEQYDFLGARARHKTIWAPHVREHARCFIFRPTVAGRLRHTVMTRLAPRLRRLKYSLYGDPQGFSSQN